MRAFLPLCLLAVPVFAAPAFAECVEPRDLQTGIIIEYIDGTFETLTPGGEGLIASHWQGPGAEARTLLVHGVYCVREQTAPGWPSDVEFFPDGGYGALPVPYPGETTRIGMGLVQNGARFRQTWEIVVSEFGDTTFGTCTYASLDVRLNIYEGGSLSYEEDYLYFPDLGIGALLGYDGPGSDDYSNTLSTLRAAGRS